MNGKIFSGGALMPALRCTTKTSGLVAAKARTPTMPTAMTATTMRAIFSTAAPSLLLARRVVPHRTNLDLEIGDAVVAVDSQHVARALDRLLVAAIVQDREAADHLLGLGERAVGDGDLAAG